MKRLNQVMVLLLGLLMLLSSCTKKNPNNMSDEEVLKIAAKAYIFGYPLVIMDLTKKVGTNIEVAIEGKSQAPINQLGQACNFPDDKFTDVVKPNVDTYYSQAWLDLANEPMVLSVPASDRYYLLPMLDAYSNVFCSPGTRTTGTTAHTFLIAGPSYMGKTPEGMELIKSPTSTVWIIGRTQVNSKKDGATIVKDFQNGLKLVPLNAYGKRNYIAPKNTVVPEYTKIIPDQDVSAMNAKEFFDYMTKLMVDNPPSAADSIIVKEMASIGIEAGKEFDTSVFSDNVKEKLDSIPQKFLVAMKKAMTGSDNKINGWSASTMTNSALGNFGIDYNYRALIAKYGLGANLQADAAYPNAATDIDGKILNSDNKYLIHFEKSEIPPVNAFWSLTMYNDKNFLAKNSINRFAIGDRSGLKYNTDGSLDLYIQRENPGKGKESNWLPTPESGTFELTMRLYWPKEDVFNGTWKPAPIKKID